MSLACVDSYMIYIYILYIYKYLGSTPHPVTVHKQPWEPTFPSFLVVISPIYWGFKTFIISMGFGVQGNLFMFRKGPILTFTNSTVTGLGSLSNIVRG